MFSRWMLMLCWARINYTISYYVLKLFNADVVTEITFFFSCIESRGDYPDKFQKDSWMRGPIYGKKDLNNHYWPS